MNCSLAYELAAVPDEEPTVSKAPYTVEPPTKHLIYVGEVVRSIRQLIHRTNYYGRFTTFPAQQTTQPNYGSYPEINFSTIGKLSIDAYTSSLFLPMLPYMRGRLTGSGGQGLMMKDGETTTALDFYETNVGIPTMTAYLSAAYVGWRGSSSYTVRIDDRCGIPQAEYGNGKVTDLSISRVAKVRTTYVTGGSWWEPFLTRMLGPANYSQTDLAANGRQRMTKLVKAGPGLIAGASGMSVTNTSKVDVVNAVTPYYSNYRMMPANPIANTAVHNYPNGLPWLNNDKNTDNSIIQQPAVNVTVNFPTSRSVNNVTFTQFPSMDVYHKAGVDFTMFWYLNPPVIFAYTGDDGWPTGWSS